MKPIEGIKIEELSWHEFKRLFRKNYLYDRYYDGETKDFYELNMGFMTVEEYMTEFLELLSYVPYLKDEKTKVQKFASGFHLAFKDWIEYDEPRSLEEIIWNLKYCYDHSKHKYEHKYDFKGNDKTK